MADIIMPALGMAQDTGKLVQWLKAPGDAVAKGDVLFEVETDKSVMEVEAQADGFLTQVSAVDGDDVPVGEVIAVISATADDAVAAPKASPEPAPQKAEQKKEPAAEAAPKPAARAPAASAENAPAASGRVLASPKAKRLAAEEGLDLDQLAAAGAQMPYHVSDLETLRNLPTPATQTGQTVVMVATKHITARCAQKGSADFIDWMQADGGITVTPGAMFASFAAGALRAATEAATVVVRLAPFEAEDVTLRNPDYTRLSAPPVETDEEPHLVLHDLSGSFLTSVRLGDTRLPTLSIGADGDSYVLTFAFSSDHLEDDQAIAFITGLARRLADPLHHLV